MGTIDLMATIILFTSFAFFLKQELAQAERVVWKSTANGYVGWGSLLPAGNATIAAELANAMYRFSIVHWVEKRSFFSRIFLAILESICFTSLSMILLGVVCMVILIYS